MKLGRIINHLACTVLFSAIAIHTVQAAEGLDKLDKKRYSPWKVLGLATGMTPDEVSKAMAEAGWKLRDERYYGYRGTDVSFLAEQEWMPGAGEIIRIHYSRPPDETRVVLVERDFGIGTHDSLPRAKMMDAIKDKYGEPDLIREGSYNILLRWYEGPNAEYCKERSPNGVFSAIHRGKATDDASCTGILLTTELRLGNGASGQLASIAKAALYDHGNRGENMARSQAYGAELSRKAEEEKMKGRSAPEF